MTRAIAACSLIAALGACPVDEPETDCGPGLQRPGTGAPCVPEVPAQPCPAGTRAEPGRADCQPVGPAACGIGFTVDPSGWGCAPVLPPATCRGAAREALGHTTCAVVGNCNAAFPPPDATLWVDAALTPAELDATHFARIGDALTAASAGAVIAVERGVYREALTFAREVHLRGRCAAEVIVENPGVMAAGLRLSSAASVEVSGMTVRGHRDGALVTRGALTLREVVLEDNREAGAVAYGGTIRLERSVVRATRPLDDGTLGRGLDIEAGGVVEAVDCALAGNADAGIYTSGSGSRLTLHRSVVRDTVASSSSGNGRGLIVRAGASARVEDSAVLGNRDIALFVAAATAEVTGSVLADTAPGPGGYFGQALELQQGGAAVVEDSTLMRHRDRAIVVNAARLELRRAAVVDTTSNALGTQGMGLFATSGGEALLEDTALIASQAMGAAALGDTTRLTLRRCLVASTRPDAAGAHGHGLVAVQGPNVEVDRCELRDNTVADLLVADARILVHGSWVHGARRDPNGQFGFGSLALAGAWLELAASRVEAAASTGLAFAGAGGVVRATAVLSNPVGLQVQGTSALDEVAAIPGTPEPGTVYVATDSVFWDNPTRLGAGELPLPAVPAL